MEKKKKKDKTPIIDGDTRPDQTIDAEEAKKKKSRTPSTEKKFTSERLSDTNSMDDYKDAK